MKYGKITVSQTTQPKEMQIKNKVMKAGILMQSQTTANVSSRCFKGVFNGATFRYGLFLCLCLRPRPLPVDPVDSVDPVEVIEEVLLISDAIEKVGDVDESSVVRFCRRDLRLLLSVDDDLSYKDDPVAVVVDAVVLSFDSGLTSCRSLSVAVDIL